MLLYPIQTFTYESAADAATVNPNGIKMLLANGLSTFFIKGKSALSNGPKSLPRNSPDCPILCNLVYDNFVLEEKIICKSFTKL